MKVKKKRRMLLSIITLLLCVNILILTVYAFFADNVVLVKHLYSSDLEVSLVRTDLNCKLFANDGSLVDYHNPTRVDFSAPTEQNLFDLEEGIYVVPGSQCIATMEVVNNGYVKFGYYVEILLDKTSSEELCDQLNIVVTCGDKTITSTLSDLTLGDEGDYISILDIGCISTFTVEIYFIDDSTINNDAMDKKVYFDLVVHAVQVTSNQNS